MGRKLQKAVSEAAFKYIERGYSPIPIPKRSKKPDRRKWQDLRIEKNDVDKHFDEDCNIGLLLGEPSNGLVDIDCDCREAVVLAQKFLVQTNMKSGRASSPASHHWYIAPDAKTIKFTDPTIKNDRAMLLELRSTGCQTLVAPSTHPSGEEYIWESFEEPTKIENEKLIEATSRVASASLLARHWNNGQRHQIALALSGALLRSAWSVDNVKSFIIGVAEAANDEEIKDRVNAVETTYQKIMSNGQATGLPTLKDLLDKRVVDCVSKWLHLPKDHPANEEIEICSSQIRIVRMADIKPERVEWLWHSRIANGKLTIIEGDPGVGKSWITCALATAMAKGYGLPFMERIEPRNVLMLSAEDGLGDTIRPRLDSMNADVSRIFALDGALILDRRGGLTLEEAIIDYNAGLVTIDPIVAYTGASIDLHRANETRSITAMLARIADRRKCAIVGLRHLAKSGQGKAIYRGLGSIDITAAARSVLLVGADPNNPSMCGIVQTKNNLAQLAGAIGYELREDKFLWLGLTDLTAEKILSPIDFRDSSPRKEAECFLIDYLKAGAKSATEIEKAAKKAGISVSTLRRAKTSLGIKSDKIGRPGEEQVWLWVLNSGYEEAQEQPKMLKHSDIEHLRANGAEQGFGNHNLAEDVQLEPPECLRDETWQSSSEDQECGTWGEI